MKYRSWPTRKLAADVAKEYDEWSVPPEPTLVKGEWCLVRTVDKPQNKHVYKMIMHKDWTWKLWKYEDNKDHVNKEILDTLLVKSLAILVDHSAKIQKYKVQIAGLDKENEHYNMHYAHCRKEIDAMKAFMAQRISELLQAYGIEPHHNLVMDLTEGEVLRIK